MAWYPGSNIGKLFKGDFGGMFPGIRRQQELKQRGMDVEQPQYDPAALAGFQGMAGQGADALAGARGAQGQALGMYTDMAQGNGPSLAQAQLAASGQQTISDQQAMAAQARGGNLASQARAAQAAGAAGQMGNAQQMAALQAQEQQAALAGMAGMSNTMAGQGLQQQMAAQGLIGGAAGQSLGAATDWGLGQRGLDLQQLESNRGLWSGLVKSGVSAAGAAMGAGGVMSDERRKVGFVPSDGQAAATLAAAKPATFEYEPGAGPPGERAGISANALAETPLGSSVVTPTEQGLAVDPGQLAALAAAGTGEQEHRLRRIEQALGVSDSQGRTFAEEPNALARRVSEQEGLAQRLAEQEAVLEMKMKRGEDVSADLAEIERLSKFIDPMYSDRPREETGFAPAPTIGPYRPGESDARAGPIPTAPRPGMPGSSEPDWLTGTLRGGTTGGMRI